MRDSNAAATSFFNKINKKYFWVSLLMESLMLGIDEWPYLQPHPEGCIFCIEKFLDSLYLLRGSEAILVWTDF